MKRGFGKTNAALLLVCLAAIGALTLTPINGPISSVRLFCVFCGDFGTPDLVGNVLLFLPMGIALGRGKVSPTRALAFGLVVSGCIEVMQTILPGRNPTLRDIVTNGMGAGLGSVFAWHVRDWIRPSMRATRLLWAAVISFLAAIALTGVLQQFYPVGGTYFVHWSPKQGHLVEWSGTVVQSRISQSRLEPGRQSEDLSAALREQLADSLVADIVAIQGRPMQGIGGIVTITNERGEEGLLIGLSGQDLIVRTRRLATPLRMRAPTYRFSSALNSSGVGDTLRLRVAASAKGACAQVNEQLHCLGRPTAGSVWTLALSNAGRGLALASYFDLASTFVLALPFGLLFWSASKRHRIVSAASLLVGFPAVAWLSGLAIPGVWDWGGIILALAAGLLLAMSAPQQVQQGASLVAG